MAILELTLIVVVFGAMATVFGLQERGEERRVLAWAEATLARLAAEAQAEARAVEARAVEARAVEAAAGDADADGPRTTGALAEQELVDVA
jgi:regulator of protease activity HflC (stomatin/prohibitin superfamily)